MGAAIDLPCINHCNVFPLRPLVLTELTRNSTVGKQTTELIGCNNRLSGLPAVLPQQYETPSFILCLRSLQPLLLFIIKPLKCSGVLHKAKRKAELIRMFGLLTC